ncbi:malonic semialdehyde reductase [Alphaproteobacteria bacterium]|nr:malonic semialdehyde reductase [Alphaproteobacteria bacterium]
MSRPAFIDQLFADARTHRFFNDTPVDDALLHELYEVSKFGPSASNTCPMRLTFVKSEEAKAKLLECVGDGNKPKIASAPVVAIVAHDLKFYTQIGKLSPHMDVATFEAQSDESIAAQASNNTWLQGGYLILAARALGLDCGPMSGFNAGKVNEMFYAGTSLRASFLLSLGYGSGANIKDRGARLDFDEACAII